MVKSNYLLYLFNVLIMVASIRAAEVAEYTEIKNLMKQFSSLTSEPATLFSVYLNDGETDVTSRHQFIIDLENNKENIQKYGDFPYNPTADVDNEEYKALEKAANENRNVIIGQIDAIEKALTYLKDILERYKFMSPEDKKAQSTTVVKYILGQTVLPQESLPVRLPALSSNDCMSWLESELKLLAYQYDHNDPKDNTNFEDYSRINLTQCLNYVVTGYSMIVSAKQANGDADVEEFYQKYSIDTEELIKNHENSIKKTSASSTRKAAMLKDMYETDAGFTISKVISYIFIISQLLIFLLFP